MAVPKRKTTQSKRDMRRAHHDKLRRPTLILCPNCQNVTVPHRVCASCGHYNGREVLSVKREAEA